MQSSFQIAPSPPKPEPSDSSEAPEDTGGEIRSRPLDVLGHPYQLLIDTYLSVAPELEG